MSKTYKRAGVDPAASSRSLARLSPLMKSTHDERVLSDMSGFAGVFDMRAAAPPGGLLVSGADGVGTKSMLAAQLGMLEGIGQDCVAMCVNDVLTTGAAPLFMLDYLSYSALAESDVEEIVGSVARACLKAECALLGGETAQMPGMYAPGVFDLAGFCVGRCAPEERLTPTQTVQPGDVLVALASSGFHSNGYSLIRELLVQDLLDPHQQASWTSHTWGHELMQPTRLYGGAMRLVKGQIKGAAHITGGGLVENLPRMLPAECAARLSPWRIPECFEQVRSAAAMEMEEACGVFNMGVGMVWAVSPQVKLPFAKLSRVLGYGIWELGRVVERAGAAVEF